MCVEKLSKIAEQKRRKHPRLFPCTHTAVSSSHRRHLNGTVLQSLQRGPHVAGLPRPPHGADVAARRRGGAVGPDLRGTRRCDSDQGIGRSDPQGRGWLGFSEFRSHRGWWLSGVTRRWEPLAARMLTMVGHREQRLG